MRYNSIVYYVTDAGYAIPTASSIYSLRRFHRTDDLEVRVLIVNFSDIQLERYREISEDVGFKIVLPDEEDFKVIDNFFFSKTHVPKTALMKFMIPRYHNSNKDIVFIDGDTWVVSSIDPLLRQPAEPGAFYAAPDYSWFSRNTLVGDHGRRHRAYFSFSGINRFYFNSGVFKSSAEDLAVISNDALEYLKENFDRVLYNDQSGFNYAAREKVEAMSLKWNYQMYFWKFFKSNDAGIVHFSGGCKPWFCESIPDFSWISGYRDVYFKLHSNAFPLKTWTEEDLKAYLNVRKKERFKDQTIFLIRGMLQKLSIRKYLKNTQF